MTNWHQIRFQYEVLGDSAPSLANAHGISALLLENTINSEGWARRAISKKIVNFVEGDTEDDMVDDINSKAMLLNTLRSSQLGPEYYKLEATLINKMNEALYYMNTDSPDAVKQLKAMAECLMTMRPAAPAANNGSEGQRLTINIAGGFGPNFENVGPKVVCDIAPRPLELN